MVMPAGRVTALIGPSGCGKSTFLRLLNRMHELVPGAAMDGEIRLDGDDIYGSNMRAQQVRTRIGMVFQKPNPFPAMSVRDNVLSGLKLARIKCSDKDALVEVSLKRAGLWKEVRDRLDQPGGALSGGQQQRLCIARSLAVAPNVLLMDEPCSALDPTSTRRVEETIAELRDEVTIVIVTHNMQQANRVSDYLRVLPGRGERAGLRGGAGPHHQDVRAHPTTRAPSTTWKGDSDDSAPDPVPAPAALVWRAGRSASALLRRAGSGRCHHIRHRQRAGIHVRRARLPTVDPGRAAAGTERQLHRHRISGRACRRSRQNTADFAGTEAEYSELYAGTGGVTVSSHVPRGFAYTPDVAGATAIMYHVSLNPTGSDPVDYLQLSRLTVARIFMGIINNWDSPTITADNKGLVLPNEPITVDYRSGQSGTTALFYDFVKHTDPTEFAAWAEQHKYPTSDRIWEVDDGTDFPPHTWSGYPGSTQQAQAVASSGGLWSIGYDEFGYAKVYHDDVAWIENASGQWVQPYTLDIAAALQTAQAGARTPRRH